MILWLTLLLTFPQASDAIANSPEVVATVEKTTLTRSAVDYLIAQRVKGIFASQADSPATFEAARSHLIDQAVVLDYLESRPNVAPSAIASEIAKIEKQLARSGQTLDQWLERQRRHRQDLEFDLRWRQHWSAYIENLLKNGRQREKAFKKWGFQFDGSQVEVSQILLKVDSDNQQAQLKLAKEIHSRLVKTGKTTEELWNAEVLAYSQSPNRTDSQRPGYVGKIEYRYPMPERFSEKSFPLEPDEVSEPFQTGIGIHIVRMLKPYPATRTIDQCKDDLDSTMKREAFKAILKRHRDEVEVVVP